MSETYISYSAISDFLRCPGLYRWKYQYRNPKTNCKVEISNPGLILGIIFEVVRKRLSSVTAEQRTLDFALRELDRFFELWLAAFGFNNQEEEEMIRSRGRALLTRFFSKPKYILGENLGGFIKIPYKKSPSIFLCGATDWVEDNGDGTLAIIDFKPGIQEEKANSLQLPIYKYLVEQKFGKPVSKTFYWYLDKDPDPREVYCNSYESDLELVFSHGDSLIKSVENNNFICRESPDWCNDCQKFVQISTGRAKLLYTEMSNSLYPQPKKEYYKIESISS